MLLVSNVLQAEVMVFFFAKFEAYLTEHGVCFVHEPRPQRQPLLFCWNFQSSFIPVFGGKVGRECSFLGIYHYIGVTIFAIDLSGLCVKKNLKVFIRLDQLASRLSSEVL